MPIGRFAVFRRSMTRQNAVVSWALACIGAAMIYATPKPSESGTGRSAKAYRAVIEAGLLVMAYPTFTAAYGDAARVPPYITAAKLEARYGGYLDRAESLAKIKEPVDRSDGDTVLRELVASDRTVLWLLSTDSRPVFAYHRGGPASGYGCVGTSDPRQASVSRCTFHGDLFGQRALQYRRGDAGTDRASIMLDFHVVDEELRAGGGP